MGKKDNAEMPDNLRALVKECAGFSMDDASVEYNPDKPSILQALADAQGTDLHVAPGQEPHPPHEAWHVAQQMEGRVEPTHEIGNLPVNDNADLEREADVFGTRKGSNI